MSFNKTAFLLLILMSFIACDYHYKSELLSIGKQLSQLDSIEDFRTNRNKPVEGVENIGQDLYAKLRSAKNSIIKIEVTTGYSFRNIDADYVIVLHRNDASSMGIKLNKKGSKYAIIGYSGGENW